MKATIKSVGFTADFTTCVVHVSMEGLPKSMWRAGNHSGFDLLQAQFPVKRGRMPSKRKIVWAAEQALRSHKETLEREAAEHRMLDAAAKYAGLTVEIP